MCRMGWRTPDTLRPQTSNACAARSPRRHSELLPDERATGRSGSRKWEHQVTARRGRGYENLHYLLLKAQRVAATSSDQDRICGFQESSLKCRPPRIPGELPVRERANRRLATAGRRRGRGWERIHSRGWRRVWTSRGPAGQGPVLGRGTAAWVRHEGRVEPVTRQQHAAAPARLAACRRGGAD